jgi:hypothetical protein
MPNRDDVLTGNKTGRRLVDDLASLASVEERAEAILGSIDSFAEALFDIDAEDEVSDQALKAVVGWSPDDGYQGQPRDVIVYRVLERLMEMHFERLAEQVQKILDTLRAGAKLESALHEVLEAFAQSQVSGKRYSLGEVADITGIAFDARRGWSRSSQTALPLRPKKRTNSATRTSRNSSGWTVRPRTTATATMSRASRM